MKITKIFIVFVCLFSGNFLVAQEKLIPLQANINLIHYQPDLNRYNNSLSKISSANDTLPFFEDFYYAPNSPFPSATHWTDSSVYISTGYGYAPPSIGVATFDGVNKKGYPYRITAQSSTSSAADTLTSKPISLFAQSGYTYSPADSIAMTFLYQRQGLGENPQTNDSLILEFYKPLYPVTSGTVTNYGKWFRSWFSRGNDNPPDYDSTFNRAFIRINDTAYFHDGFRFRFRNKATGAGIPDNWNLDYISIKKNYFKTDTVYDEVALGYMPRPVLKNYSAMPYYQFTPTEMGSKFSCFIRNNGTSQKNTNYEYAIIDASGAVLSSYGAGASNTDNVKPFLHRGWDSVPAHCNPPISYTFSPMTDSTHFYIKHAVGTTPDQWRYNDTIYQKLEFNNFYAYDDGSAEAAYFLNRPSSKSALRFTLNTTDTLRALDLYFVPFIDGHLVQQSSFRMCVWSDGGGKPGTVIMKDSLMYPKYLQFGRNNIPRYFFTGSMILAPGTYYAGIVQSSNMPLYMGFDRNFEHKNALYYDVSGFWKPSEIPGSIMMHPVLGPQARALVGVSEIKPGNEGRVKIYPNPAGDQVYISAEGVSRNCAVELYSVLGNRVYSGILENGYTGINTSELSAGIYFVLLKENTAILSRTKIIISH